MDMSDNKGLGETGPLVGFLAVAAALLLLLVL
jgi:hypothetical protein